MGAIAVPRPSSSSGQSGKPVSVTLDQFGRDPQSPAERLRRLSNLKNGTGYAPFFTAWLADLPRLSSGHVFDMLVVTIACLSLGRPDNPPKGKRHDWTKPISLEDLSSICRCHLRDVQRQVRDGQQRGVFRARQKSRGLYEFSLLYLDWQALPDYEPARPVAIDEPEEDEPDAEPEPEPVSKDAVRLVRRPLKVQSGKMGRRIAIQVGVKSLRWQNSASLPLVFDGSIQGGELVVSARLASDWREAMRGEEEAKSRRHGCRDAAGGPPASESDLGAVHPRAADVLAVFDPLLEASGSRLLIGDSRALLEAARALGDVPRDYLLSWLHTGDKARATRPVSSPKVVASIVREVAENWARAGRKPAVRKPAAGKEKSAPKSGSKGDWVAGVKREAARRLEKFGRI